MRRIVGAACAAMALATAPVQAACWNVDETSAATVRELQSMLMVAALRCQVAHHDMTGDYNVFLRANKDAIQRMNDRLKAHFIKADGPVKGQTSYDAFTTSLANGHGSEGAGAELCAGTASLAREAGMMAGSVEGLLLLAAREGLVVKVPDGACANVAPTTIALAEPAVAAAPAPALAAVAAAMPTTIAAAMPTTIAAATPAMIAAVLEAQVEREAPAALAPTQLASLPQ